MGQACKCNQICSGSVSYTGKLMQRAKYKSSTLSSHPDIDLPVEILEPSTKTLC